MMGELEMWIEDEKTECPMDSTCKDQGCPYHYVEEKGDE